jgi:hypothetical protein
MYNLVNIGRLFSFSTIVVRTRTLGLTSARWRGYLAKYTTIEANILDGYIYKDACILWRDDKAGF